MLADEFVRQTVRFWSAYFEKIKQHAKGGQLSASAGCSTYYPLILICTETPDIFLAELVGIQEDFRGLTLKRHRLDSATLYVNQLPVPTGPSVIELSAGNKLMHLCLGHQVDILALRKRFPVVDLFPTRIFMDEQVASPGSAIQFGTGFESARLKTASLLIGSDRFSKRSMSYPSP